MILGSMPSTLSLEKQQYYGNKRNHFWPIMSEILACPLPEKYMDRTTMLLENGIGLWDSIASCERQGSLDATITEEIPHDFAQFFSSYPAIQAVFFNGAKAETIFKKYSSMQQFSHITFYKMPSTSPIPGKNIKSFDEKVVCWKKIIQYL
ncbi:DNA-deoxyinosine glycosylase [Kurthia sibirica]|uniref:DNA-deoxyinosine glycosylase n=2 Tax=Kurthia sibirica TaxID=202750 RepID=A0A2U3AKU9_9BACL|nr:DNA-deoxyinosine glycosylase [Kurthia sibirica]